MKWHMQFQPPVCPKVAVAWKGFSLCESFHVRSCYALPFIPATLCLLKCRSSTIALLLESSFCRVYRTYCLKKKKIFKRERVITIVATRRNDGLYRSCPCHAREFKKHSERGTWLSPGLRPPNRLHG